MKRTVLAILVVAMLVLQMPPYESVRAISNSAEYIFSSEEGCLALRQSDGGEDVLRGDMDSNGAIGAVDLFLMKKLTAFGSVGFDLQYSSVIADVNGDLKINLKDLYTMKLMLLNYEAPTYATVGDSKVDVLFSKPVGSALLIAPKTFAYGHDAYLTLNSADEIEKYPFAVITYMAETGEGKNSDCAQKASVGNGSQFNSFSIINSGKFEYAVVDMSGIDTDGELVFRYFNCANEGDRIYVDSIILCADRDSAAAAGAARAEAKKDSSFEDGMLVSFDRYGNAVIRFDSQKKIDNFVSLYKVTDYCYDSEEAAMKLKATATTDPGVYLDLSECGLSCDDYQYILYNCKIPTTNKRRSATADIYFASNGQPENGSGQFTATVDLLKNGIYTGYVFDMTSRVKWQGSLTKLRIDYFTTATTNDCSYVDSIVLCKNEATVQYAKTALDYRRADGENTHVSNVWKEYTAMGAKDTDSAEYVISENGKATVYFRYGSNDALTAESLGARMARGISEATGYTVKCEIYCGVTVLKDTWDLSVPHGKIYYVLSFGKSSYILYLDTCIIKDETYSDELDGHGETDPVYELESTWFEDGINISDSVGLPVSTSGVSAHSNHENRIVRTPYGAFAAIPMSEDANAGWGAMDTQHCTIYMIDDSANYREIGHFDFANHTSKPNIYYAADGLVYVVVGDVQGDYVSAMVAYFDPSSQSDDGSFDVTYSREELSYSSGAAPGGYGYTQPILDDYSGYIYLYSCGGSNEGYFSWSIYDYKTHSWMNRDYTVKLDTYRHCYLYGFSDGAGGVYIVGGRDVLLSTLGLDTEVTGADYAWDEVNLFHFKRMTSPTYTRTTVRAADYSQRESQLYPVTSCNCYGDAYLTGDGYLHVITSTCMHRSFHHDVAYWELWHTVYDVREPGSDPVLVSTKPISFGRNSATDENQAKTLNVYSVRMCESVDGRLYILAMPADGTHHMEIWGAKDSSAVDFEMVGNINFKSTRPLTTGMIVTNSRNGSVIDNTVNVIYPTDDGNGCRYRISTVTLK